MRRHLPDGPRPPAPPLGGVAALALLGELLREEEEPPQPPLGGEPLHVRVLALLFGAVAAGFGVAGGLRSGSFEGRPTTLLVVGGVLFVVGIAAFVRASRRRG